MSRRSALAALAAATLALGATGCARDKDVAPPAALVDFDATLAVERAWSANLGGRDRRLRLALAPAVADGRVYAAGADGDVAAFDAGNGRALWRTRTRLPLAAGPALGAGLVVAGASDGRLVALDAASGAERWRVQLSGEVLAPPTVAAEAVVVRTVDGFVRALRPADGSELWFNEESVPRLTLRGTARPAVAGDTVVAAFDNGSVSAYALGNGDVLWETQVSPPRGRTELERLVDIDGDVHVAGRDVYVVGFQGRAAQLALDSGQIWWARELSSHRGLALGDDLLYVTVADSTVQALRRRDGTAVWTSEALVRRGLTAPVVDGDALVVADFEGWVHWLDRRDGSLLGRARAGRDRFTNAPVAADGLVFVQSDGGRLEALRARARGR